MKILPETKKSAENIAEKSDLNRKRVYSSKETNLIFDKYCDICFLDVQKVDKRQKQRKSNLRNQNESDNKVVIVADIQGDKIDMNMSIDQNVSGGL